ncbi:MAG TPA: ATPase, T2SS/T4P/T4SS family [Kofleriaceae bacterium]|jgi:pilus assembly protein CpaF
MFTILIQEKGGEQRRMVFNKAEVTIGRVQGNDIVLPKGNVSKRHARIVLKDGKFIIVDLKSTNGTYVNGRKITSPLVVKDSDKIYIGDFIVGVDEASASEGDGPSESTTSPPAERLQPPAERSMDRGRPTEAQPMPMPMGMAGMQGLASGPLDNGPPDLDAPPPRRPAPAPMAAPSERPLGAGAAAGPAPAPRSAPPRPAPGPREPTASPMARDLSSAPHGAAAPPSQPLAPPAQVQTRPPGRPVGGTMPPPMAPIPPMAPPVEAPAVHIPPPVAAPAPAPMAPPMQSMPHTAAMQTPLAVPSAAPAPVAAPTTGAAAPLSSTGNVVPLASSSAAKRGLVGAGAKKVVGRAVSAPGRRGVNLEPLDPKVVKMLDLQSNILERLRAKLDLDKVPMDRLHEEDLWQKAERATIDLVETLETSGELPKYIDQDTLIKETLNEALALGPLEDLLADEAIDEILIDRRDRVVVGKGGTLRGSGKAFSSDDVFEKVVKRLVAEAGAVIDEARPLVDLRMRDGTRLTAAVSPVAARGAVLVLKKPAAAMPKLPDLVASNALSSGMADFLATCVTARRNILVCGGPASGKTSVAAALAAASPPGERVVSIEESGELAIGRDEWIQLESRAGTGRNADIDLAALLETALRLSPDRLIVGEVRGREALPLIYALNAAVDGAVVAMTGEGANAALTRLATLARASSATSDPSAIRELVAQAFEIVVHVTRIADGSLRVASIEEIASVSDGGFETHLLFHLRDGSYHATGTVPRFYAELAERGIQADQAVFR